MMLDNGFKLEVESLTSRDISFVTEEYVPQRLKEGQFLD
jgi:DNA topoisomerase-6 subunit A